MGQNRQKGPAMPIPQPNPPPHTRRERRAAGIPARSLFPPLPPQCEVWQAAHPPAIRASGSDPPRALPALPFAGVMRPFGMLALSVLR